jgi:hypothetical protein
MGTSVRNITLKVSKSKPRDKTQVAMAYWSGLRNQYSLEYKTS